MSSYSKKMKTTVLQCSVEELCRLMGKIEFPEFQREPSVWPLHKKQLLVDSIFRGFTIGTLYFTTTVSEFKEVSALAEIAGSIDCIDGRQRVSAIWAYRGILKIPDDHTRDRLKNDFEYAYDVRYIINSGEAEDSNESESNEKALQQQNGKKFDQLPGAMRDDFNKYQVSIVLIQILDSDAAAYSALASLFLRLNLGEPLKGSERLKAMRGSMRDFVFGLDRPHNNDEGVPEFSRSAYFNALQTTKFRYYREMTAAQIASLFFSVKNDKGFVRTRYEDLQDFFRRYAVAKDEFTKDYNELVSLSNNLESRVENTNLAIGNRAMAVSYFLAHAFIKNRLIGWEPIKADNFDRVVKALLDDMNDVGKKSDSRALPEFASPFIEKLRQTMTQASAESYSHRRRNELLLRLCNENPSYAGSGALTYPDVTDLT